VAEILRKHSVLKELGPLSCKNVV